jgi:hypothetical protein
MKRDTLSISWRPSISVIRKLENLFAEADIIHYSWIHPLLWFWRPWYASQSSLTLHTTGGVKQEFL